MATTTRKGAASRSYPSRQRKLGPAPFASFEDLSDEQDSTSPPDNSESNKVQPMPEIKEDGVRTPDEQQNRCPTGTSMTGMGTSSSSGFAGPSSVPTSGPTSGLQTPSTPRIDISCASSSTPPSEESASERELFQGGLGFAFHEEGTEELRSSTEELDLGEDDLQEESSRKKKNEPEDLLRRASHPANIFSRKASTSAPPEEDQGNRKPSAHSLYLDGFLARPSRHSSFGSADYNRPGAISSLSANSGGSGRRSSSPHKMLLETSFCGSKPIPTPSLDLDSPPKEALALKDNGGKISSDSSLESHKPPSITTLTTVQVHHHNQPIASPSPYAQAMEPAVIRTSCISPGSPKSSDHWRPISPRTPRTDTENTQFAFLGNKEDPWQTSTTVNPPPPPPRSNPQVCTQSKSDVEPTQRQPRNSSVDRSDIKTPVACVQDDRGDPVPASHVVPDKQQLVEENDEITTELKISEDPVVTVEDVPLETKGLFLNESLEDDGDLPYVPTTLPLEKSVVVPIISIKERRKLGQMVTTTPVQRPRCIRPPNPTSLNDYIAYSTVPRIKGTKTEEAKMKINLPREDSIPDTAQLPGTKKKMSTSWTDFAELGLRSPREIRRRMREENGAIDDLSSYHSDSSQDTAGQANGSDEETESLLKLPKVPFAMDLDVHSNRSSVVSQEEGPHSPQCTTGSPDLPQDIANFHQPD